MWRAASRNKPAISLAYGVTVPSLDDWEKQWQKNPQGMEKPKAVPGDFETQQTSAAAEGGEEAVAAVAQEG